MRRQERDWGQEKPPGAGEAAEDERWGRGQFLMGPELRLSRGCRGGVRTQA